MKVKILDFIRRICIYFIKKDYLKKISKYGKCKITDDKIICIVDGEKLKKKYNKHICYDLWFVDASEKDKKVLEVCGLDKRVQYIIKNVKFDKKIYINSYGNNELIFKECMFYEHININHVKDITLEKNQYISLPENDIFWISCRRMEDAECVRIINDNLISTTELDDLHNVKKDIILVNPYIYAKKVELINCFNIKSDVFRINTNNLNIQNSNINCNEAYITADNIESTNNKINVKNGIIIENGNNNSFVESINCPYIIYNDDEITVENCNSQEKDCLNVQRKKLLDTLKKIRNVCGNNILYRMNKISNNMSNESVKKILKK